jgi:hypothetical protein
MSKMKDRMIERMNQEPAAQPKLSVELVPQTVWYRNLRSELSREEWDRLRKACYHKAWHRCEICHDTGLNQGYNWPVECHEIWHYDDEKKVQKLMGLIALCPLCHMVKHLGKAGHDSKLHIALPHLGEVNGWTERQIKNYTIEVHQQWAARSKHEWTQDLSILKTL